MTKESHLSSNDTVASVEVRSIHMHRPAFALRDTRLATCVNKLLKLF